MGIFDAVAVGVAYFARARFGRPFGNSTMKLPHIPTDMVDKTIITDRKCA